MASSRGRSRRRHRDPRATANRPGADALDEAGKQRRAGHEPHQRRRFQEPRAAAEKLHLDAIAAEMAIHQHRDDAVVRQAAANLQRGVERLPTSMVSAPSRSRISRRSRLTSGFASAIATIVSGRSAIRRRKHRRLPSCRSGRVTRMMPSALRQQIDEQLRVLGRCSRIALRSGRGRRSARMKSMASSVYARRVAARALPVIAPIRQEKAAASYRQSQRASRAPTRSSR